MPQMCGVFLAHGLDAHGCRMEQLAGTRPGATASRLLATSLGGMGVRAQPEHALRSVCSPTGSKCTASHYASPSFPSGPADVPAIKQCDPLTIVSANYVVRTTWAKGFVVDVTVVVDCLNSGRKNRFGVDGFRIAFDLPDGATVAKTWNGTLYQDGSVCTVSNSRFCKPLDRGQAVLYFGFEARLEMAQTNRSPSLPTTMHVNGQVCTVKGCFARDLADCRNDDSEDEYNDAQEPEISEAPPTEVEGRDHKAQPSRERCASAPPVLYHSFGLAAPRGDDESHLSDTTVCAERCCSWGQDYETQSIAETVRDRRRGDSCAHAGSSVQDSMSDAAAVLTPPLRCAWHPGCESAIDTPCQSRKRKFLEEDAADHTVVCSESSVDSPRAEHCASASSCWQYPRTLQIDYYRRSKALKRRKYLHMDFLDANFRSREQVILSSVLDDLANPIVLEPNMFPYDTPAGVTHWTLWSRKWLQEEEVEAFVDGWLAENLPEALEWNHDDNMADGLSINLFHVHVYIRCRA